MVREICSAAFVSIWFVTASLGADVAAVAAGASRQSIDSVSLKRYDRRFGATINAIEDEMAALGVPGAAVAIIEAGEVTLAAGFGSRHPHREIPVEATTLFRIGSVTKTLTAIGLLQLVDQGLVDLDAPITDYVPEFDFTQDASWAPSITPRHLLTHTSAMLDFFELETPGYYDDEALSRYFSGPYQESPYAYLMAPAGRMFNYSNPGYMLAGWVTEAAGGTYYRLYLEENVFIPLGMTRTFFLPQHVVEDRDYAFGSAMDWETGEESVLAPDSYDNGWGRPAGLGFSCVLDLAELVRFLRAGNPDVLADDLRLAMQEPQVDTLWLADKYHYGYGLTVQEGGFYHPSESNFYDLRVVWHGGDVPGFSADVWYVPALDFGFVSLTNAGYLHLNTSFATALTTLCDMPAPVAWPDFSMTPGDHSGFAGRYLDRYNVGQIIVRAEGGELTVEIPALDQIGVDYEPTLVQSAGDNFVLYISSDPRMDRLPLQVTFLFDDTGRPEYFRTRSFVAEYVGPAIVDPDRPSRFEGLRVMAAPRVLESWPHLPGPPLPFVTPPAP